MNIEKGKFYLVTKDSNDRTFRVGDHIKMDTDGSINCYEAGGWVDSSDVAECIKGMEAEIDKEWVKKQRVMLLSQLAELEEGELSSLDAPQLVSISKRLYLVANQMSNCDKDRTWIEHAVILTNAAESLRKWVDAKLGGISIQKEEDK